MPFERDDDAPWWGDADVPDEVLLGEPSVPEVPAALLEAPHTADGDLLVPPCDCPHCEEPVTRETDVHHAPDSLADRFAREWSLVQRHTARAWKAAAAMHAHVDAERGAWAAEHVGADLALITNTHPRTGEALMMTSVRACREVPELAELVETGQMSGKHVDALLDEAGRWTDTREQAAAVIQLTLDRCRERAAAYGWPTPGQLRKRLRTAALLLDLGAAEKRRRSVAERRGAALLQTGAGAASLVIEGPDVPLLQAYDAIRARAEAMGRLPEDTRTHDQRMYDAALELLAVDADGGDAVRHTTGAEGEPVHLVVRGVEIAVLVPYSVAEGGNLELAEVVGFGPILPSTARELVDQARSFRRVAVDATTGEVVAVDDRWKAPRDEGESSDDGERDGDGDGPNDGPGDTPSDGAGGGPGRGGGSDRGGGPADGPAAPPAASPPAASPSAAAPASAAPARPAPARTAPAPATPASAAPAPAVGRSISPTRLALVRRMARRRVMWQDLRSSHYRVPGRLRRHLALRDRTCTFPGCHVPGRYCDVDHREEWPRGGTHDGNCHCLCRRHHRAKQDYFTVRLDTTNGDTCWTTPDGRTYRRPPPRF